LNEKQNAERECNNAIPKLYQAKSDEAQNAMVNDRRQRAGTRRLKACSR
jgi:hypothetical protein